jgi:hypothetical protein
LSAWAQPANLDVLGDNSVEPGVQTLRAGHLMRRGEGVSDDRDRTRFGARALYCEGDG